ncbi:uncharacterized protein LOC142586905 isoform X2 [Dermacentor variabilis]|uniref:uncharacterized protein LOC142586905 isoform X2 n=1 Tax=Dermacentor variabilis TaxID=34621 RepID=UPI003F5C1993
MTMSPAATVRVAVLLVLCGAVLADTVYSLKTGKVRQVKKGHHKKQKQHPDRWPSSEHRRPKEDEAWKDLEEMEKAVSSEEESDPWEDYASVPTVRVVHKGGLIPPVIEHDLARNLSEDESLEPVTICGPGWHAPLSKRPTRRQRILGQQPQMSFSGVQFFFGDLVRAKLASASLDDQEYLDDFPSNKPDEDTDSPFIVS